MDEFGFTELRDSLRQEYIEEEGWDESQTMNQAGKTVPKYVLSLKLKSGRVVKYTGVTHWSIYEKLPQWLKREVAEV